LLDAGISSVLPSPSSSVRSLGDVCPLIFPFYTTHEDFSDRLSGAMLISGAMLLGPPTGLHAVCTRVLACVPCVLAREDVWWSGSRLECQAHLSEGDVQWRHRRPP